MIKYIYPVITQKKFNGVYINPLIYLIETIVFSNRVWKNNTKIVKTVQSKIFFGKYYKNHDFQEKR